MLVLEVLTAFLILGVPAGVILVLVLYQDRQDSVVHDTAAPMQTVTIPVSRHDSAGLFYAEDRGCWWVSIVDTTITRRVEKIFSGHLVLGRTLPFDEKDDRLYVGEDPTISRDQCAIFSFQGGIWIENLSGVNITRHNGHPLQDLEPLRQGDILVLGSSRFIVQELQPHI